MGVTVCLLLLWEHLRLCCPRACLDSTSPMPFAGSCLRNLRRMRALLLYFSSAWSQSFRLNITSNFR